MYRFKGYVLFLCRRSSSPSHLSEGWGTAGTGAVCHWEYLGGPVEEISFNQPKQRIQSRHTRSRKNPRTWKQNAACFWFENVEWETAQLLHFVQDISLYGHFTGLHFCLRPPNCLNLTVQKHKSPSFVALIFPLRFAPGATPGGAVPLNELPAAFSCGGEVRPSGHPGQASGPSLKKKTALGETSGGGMRSIWPTWMSRWKLGSKVSKRVIPYL